MVLWYVRDGWRDIYAQREDFFFPSLLPGARGCQPLHPPCKLVRDASDRLRVPRSTAILCTLSKSDHVVLITWSPSGYTPVVPDSSDRAVIYLFTNENVTACQSIRGHSERTENPCHMLYNRWIKTIQTTTLLRSVRIVKRVQETWGDLLSPRLQWNITDECWCEELTENEDFARSKKLSKE